MFAVLHVAAFPLHAVLRTEATSASQPAALFSAHSKKSVVLAVTSAAAAAGVELGMTAAQAVARCPRLLLRSPRPDAESEARATLLAVAQTLSPTLEDTAPGICTVDLRGLSSEKFLPAAHAVLAQLAQLALLSTIGLARTPLLALYAARATTTLLYVDTAAAERTFLAPLPIAAADPSPELADVLWRWGLRTLGEFTALPRDEIVLRFGAAGLALWQRASGGDLRPLRPVIPPQTFSAAMEFENAIETLDPLLFILRRILDRLSLELISAQFVAAELALTLRLEDETTHARSFRLPEPTADVEILFRTLHTYLESLQTAACIVALSLEVTPTRPLVRQQGLFDTGLRDPHGFAETLARLSALVGPERLGTPHRVDTHRPDACELLPPAAAIPAATITPLHPPLGGILRRYRPPLRVGLTETNDGKTFLWANGARGEIAFRSPPYPRDGDWWQKDRAWSRIEWDVALADGGLYRLILVGGDHFLEGEYD